MLWFYPNTPTYRHTWLFAHSKFWKCTLVSYRLFSLLILFIGFRSPNCPDYFDIRSTLRLLRVYVFIRARTYTQVTHFILGTHWMMLGIHRCSKLFTRPHWNEYRQALMHNVVGKSTRCCPASLVHSRLRTSCALAPQRSFPYQSPVLRCDVQ